ncbi:MAG: sulfatase family protein [Jatrophihabitans sp.]|uniref:sulfatase family protein n=1 Tax=Jatrophihabitans sp. TaxID=1932789 RepID=UPI003F7D5245
MLRRSRVVPMLVAALGCLLLAACTTPAKEPHRDDRRLVQFTGRPNIVFVLADDLSTNLLPFMPHVQALAREGASFSNYFVVDSLCCPSRAAIFTGQYPHDDGVFTNAGADGGVRAFDHFGGPAKNYGLALHRAGYFTGMLGKYLNRYDTRSPLPPGWDDWWVSGYGYYQYGYAVNDNGHSTTVGYQPSDYLGTRLAGQATSFVRSAVATGKPFAVEVAPFSPHWPYVAAPQDVGTFPGITVPRTPAYGVTPQHAPKWLAGIPPLTAHDGRHFDDAFRKRVESVQEVDRTVGQLQQALQQQGVLQNTYFVFSSDNGYHMGDYRLRVGKQTAFDTDTHVPLIIAGPGIRPGSTIDAVTQSIDLAPTFAAWAHTTLPTDPDGIDLGPLLTGRVPSAAWPQQAALVEHHGQQVKDDPDHQVVLEGRPPSYEALRTKDALYVEYVDGEREYYDLRHDPFETDNLAGSSSPAVRATVARLSAWLHRLETCHGHAACLAADRAAA